MLIKGTKGFIFMGKSCCEAKSSELEVLRSQQGNVLKIVFWLNALMFFFEFSFGFISRSSALMADSLDMFGDAAVYGSHACPE